MSPINAELESLMTQVRNHRMCCELLIGFVERAQAENDMVKMQDAYLAALSVHRQQSIKEISDANQP